MKLSVIIPTYQGKNKVLNILDNLESQTIKDFEVVVVIDGSTDGTLEALKNKNFEFQYKVIYQENKGRAAVRNTGVRNCSGDHLIFFDDDMILPTNIIEKYRDAILNIDSPVIVGSLYSHSVIENEFTKFSKCLGDRWDSSIPWGNFKFGYNYITANNFYINKELFDSMGGFNEKLNDAEDLDLALRLNKNGYSIYYNYELRIGHLTFESFEDYAKRMRQYGTFRPIVEDGDAQTLTGAKDFIFYLLSFRFWIILCDFGIFSIFPKLMKYKFYDVVLMANYYHGKR